MRALVVGAGAVGQVYGRHLSQGGVDVTFLVKPKHVQEMRAGLTLYRLNRRGRRRSEPERFERFDLVSSVEEVRQRGWDHVFLAISSTALREGDWFASLAGAIGEATLVLLQPGPEDRQAVLESVPEERVVQGVITLISYPAPLPGETRFPEPGIAYWFPPFAASPMSGQATRVDTVVEVLNRGGLPARRVAAVSDRAPFGAALLIPLIAGLERAGWRFSQLARSEHLRPALAAAHQSAEIVARHTGRRRPLPLRLAATPLVVRAVLRVAPLLVPFDLETYLRVHFTKVGDQTRDILHTYIDWAALEGMESDALEALLA